LSYQPYSLESTYPVLFEPGLGDTSFVDEDFPSSDEHFLSYSAGVAYLRRISRRMSVQAGYDYHVRPEVQGEADRYARQTFRGRVTRELGKGLGAHAGYIYSHALYDDEGDDDFGHHTIDVGLDFSRAFSLSLSRRTTLSFSTGTSIYQTAEPTFHFRLIGAARLSHEMGRTWNATVSYDRGFGLTDTWSEPVFSDSATAGVGGLIAPRTELRFSGRALFGGGVSGSYGDIQTMNGSGELSFALSRHVNTALTYVYYRQQLADDVALVEGFPPDYDGQSIRLSVNVWAPLFQRARRP
jgi:hypothetical protein